MRLTVTTLVLRNCFPNIYHKYLEMGLQDPAVPQSAEIPLQHHLDQRGLGNQHSFSPGLIPITPNGLMPAAQSMKYAQ